MDVWTTNKDTKQENNLQQSYRVSPTIHTPYIPSTITLKECIINSIKFTKFYIRWFGSFTISFHYFRVRPYLKGGPKAEPQSSLHSAVQYTQVEVANKNLFDIF